jgi:hypothetical protein
MMLSWLAILLAIAAAGFILALLVVVAVVMRSGPH